MLRRLRFWLERTERPGDFGEGLGRNQQSNAVCRSCRPLPLILAPLRLLRSSRSVSLDRERLAPPPQLLPAVSPVSSTRSEEGWGGRDVIGPPERLGKGSGMVPEANFQEAGNAVGIVRKVLVRWCRWTTEGD
ncbi:hypothetical protein MDA_GLEAN10004225 [Myotis davidii]|uniref:Uncharacterized protein n=1 Tax=Myotis davidii TaxID=225400 RepID=L5LSP0_MYODS|nr:hypothetical protein MDA_GLEAN10004225 [Myotis davidii]